MRDASSVPYRRTPPAESGMPHDGSRELVVVGGVLWAGSVARVLFAFATHENFGAVSTLAFVVLVALPIMAIPSLRRFARRAR